MTAATICGLWVPALKNGTCVLAFVLSSTSIWASPLPVSWVVTSIAFGLYATYVASYTSVFGHLASIFVLLLYIWLSANSFLVGIQVDAEVRERA